MIANTIRAFTIWSLAVLAGGVALAEERRASPANQTATAEEIQQLIRELGIDNLDVRNQARRRLTEIGMVALPALREALKGEDGEGRVRVERIINEITAAADRRGRDWLAKKLAKFKGVEGGQIIPVTQKSVARVFPEHLFYVLRFRQYPVARVAPDPLKANNLFVVKPVGAVEHIRDAEGLEGFFRATLARVRTEIAAKDAANAWLDLSQEFHQDGFFQFSVPDDAVRVSSAGNGFLQVTGKAVVNQHGGNTGEIVASLTFDQAGVLVKVSETARVRAGIRPRCQATKLLDPDPIVRRMAEQAILVMGKAAKEYLDEQRAKASPELQQAIDRIWERSLAQDR